MDWINALVQQFPTLLSTEEIGKTYQGKSIVAVHLRSSKGTNKPRIIYNSCQHAREWVTITTNSWVLNTLVQGFGKNETLTELVDKIDWTFIPIVNVDGYDFTWSNNRMWRKTRKPNSGSSCVGVDPNRNWSYMWNRGGSSSDPCNDAYHGPAPGSESEPLALANFVKNTPRVMGYIDIHSYSQLWMSPWGYTTALPADYSRMKGLMTPICNAIRETNGRRYVDGNIASTIYIASGSSVDYTYGQLGIVYSFAVELRDTGQYGFILPPAQIRPQGEEFMAGVIVMANAIKAEYYNEQ
jgi:murein tripeptide amidase MpaA